MDNYMRLKIDSLQMQLEIIKTQLQRSKQSNTGKTGGLKQLRDLLKGKLDVSEQDLLDSRFVFKINHETRQDGEITKMRALLSYGRLV